MVIYSKAAAPRKCKLCSRDADLLRIPSVRAVVRKAGVSPSLAIVIATLAGLFVEGR